MLAQTMSRTNPTAPKSSIRIGRASSVIRCCSAGRAIAPADGKAVGRSAASCRLRDVISDAACSLVTPAFSLPMHSSTLRGSRLVAGSWSGVQISTAVDVGMVPRN
jgi:hypothetical protein